MDDIISRQTAIDALEKVAELFPWRVPGNRDTYDSYNEAWQDALDRAENEIENLPSAQPDIIQCKDCKYWDSFPSCSAFSDLHICKYWMCKISTMEGDFCSRAERREDG